MSEKDGGAAFPHAEIHDSFSPDGKPETLFRHMAASSGLTKLEWFAGMALPGVIVGIMAMADKHPLTGIQLKHFANEAFEIGQAMLAESERRKS